MLAERLVAVAALGRVHAGGATVFASAAFDGFEGGAQPLRNRVEAAFANARAGAEHIEEEHAEEERAAGNAEELTPDEVAELGEELEAEQDSAPETPEPENPAEPESPADQERPPEPESLAD